MPSIAADIIPPAYPAPIALQNLLSGQHAVNSRRHKSSGLSGSLAGGVQPPQGRLAALIPENPHRGRAAGLRPGEHTGSLGKSGQLLIQQGQGLLQSLGYPLGQHLMQIAPVDTRAIGRRNLPRSGAGASGQEITQLMGRGAVAAAELIRFALNGLLPVPSANPGSF